MYTKLKEIREYEGKTQNEIAEYLNVDRSTYAGWECDKDIIPFPKLIMAANYFNVSLDYLIGKTEDIEIVKGKLTINKEKVASNLKSFRLKNNFTQKELAKSLKTSQSNIHKYETGKCLITTTYALELSKQYDYSLDTLLDRK